MSTEDKLNFLARYGAEKHIHEAISSGDEPAIRSAFKNSAFSKEHHEKMMNDSRLSVRRLTILGSPHTSADDITKALNGKDNQDNGMVSYAIHHPKARVEDIKKVAFTHPEPNVVGAVVRLGHRHQKWDWTADELKQIGNRTFAKTTSTPVVPIHILNSVLPKDHAPLTQTDVHNHMVTHQGGTL